MIRNEEIRTKYTADVTGAVRDLQRLADQQRDVGKSLEGASQAGSKFMGLMDKLAGLAAPTAAVALLKKGFDELAEYQTLSARASTVAVDKIIAGTKGLVTNMDAMRMAAKLAGKVTSEQMETAAKAAFALSREGFDLKETFEKLTQSILKGKAEGLDDLGLKFREAKTEGEKFNAMMETLGAKAKEGEAATLGTTGSVQKLGVDMQNSMDKIKRSLGEIVVAMEPLISATARLASVVADLAGDAASLFADLTSSDAWSESYGFGSRRNTQKAIGAFNQAVADGTISVGMSERDIASEMSGPSRVTVRETIDPRIAEAKARRKARRGSSRPGPSFQDLNGVTEEELAALLGMIGNTAEALPTKLFSATIGASVPVADLAEARDVMVDMAKVWGEVDATAESMIVQMLGPIDEIDGYRVAFDGLTSAVTAAFSAWIDGSAGAADAAKQAVRDTVKALAIEAAQRSIYETAAGIVALTNPVSAPTAAGHFKAAALYGIVAAGAGAAARAIGPAGGSGAGAYGGGSGRSGGGAYSGGTTTTIISYGDSMSDDSHRMRQSRARRLVALAGNVSGRDAVRYE